MSTRLLLSAIGDSEVSNTTTETTIFTGTVPGGTLGTNTLLILRMLGDALNNSGAGTTFTLRVKYGGTTIHTFTSISQGSNVNRHADFTTVFLGAENSATAQRSYMEHKQGGAAAPGQFANGNDHNNSVNSGIAINSALDQTLAVTVQLSAAASTVAFRRRGVWVEHHAPTQGTGTDQVLLHQTGFSYNNTTAETSVASFTIPGGTIGTGNLVIVRTNCDVLNNSGGNAEWIANLYLAGSQVFDPQNGVANPSSAQLYAFPTEWWIGGHGATNDQVLGCTGHQLNSPTGSGEGSIGGGAQANQSYNSSTFDSTVDQTFELKTKFDTASTNLQMNYRGALVAVIK